MPTITVPFTRLLAEELPTNYHDALSALVAKAYKAADVAGKYAEEAGTSRLLAPLERDRLSDAQGAFVQHYLHQWAANFSELTAGFGANSRKRQHVQIKTSRALLTPHRVLSPSAFPASAVYRDTNALANQCWLPFVQNDAPMSDGSIYLYLLHGPSLANVNEPGFIQIALPSPANREYLAIHDIYKHTDFSISNKVEEIADTAVITLKSNAKKKERSAS